MSCQSLTGSLLEREISGSKRRILNRLYIYPELINRLNLYHILKGHEGCVNCLQWNDRGNLLASGSDDLTIGIWHPFQRRGNQRFQSGHTNNIFSIKFLPCTNDQKVASGAADFRIRLHDLEAEKCFRSYSCHVQRVKRLAVAPNQANLLWSAGEDGMIMQFDTREDYTCNRNCAHVLVNLHALMGKRAEAKCVAINPCRPEYIAYVQPPVQSLISSMLSLKRVSFGNEVASSSIFDDSTAEILPVEGEDYNLPNSSTRYYYPGHLSVLYDEYRKKHRPLATTYLTFSPSGDELLVNLGGEQLYMYNMNDRKISLLSRIHSSLENATVVQTTAPITEQMGSGGDSTNGYSKNGLLHSASNSNATLRSDSANDILSFVESEEFSTSLRVSEGGSKLDSIKADMLRKRANEHFRDKTKVNHAIDLYCQALELDCRNAVLYSNRAAAYMKRKWDGDIYAAIRDCCSALCIEPDNLKALFRLARCLSDMRLYQDAAKCFDTFRAKFPDDCDNKACRDLLAEIKLASDETKRRPDRSSKNKRTMMMEFASFADLSVPSGAIGEQESQLRAGGIDYESRFCGHCNTTTDIKEANFFGKNGEYIIAGSDDGSFFTWKRSNGCLVRVMKADTSIVNCLQPHPSTCLLATSGIDTVVRLWAPQSTKLDDSDKNELVVKDRDQAASENQKRMNSDPLEIMLQNMSNRISGMIETPGDDSADDSSSIPQCRQS